MGAVASKASADLRHRRLQAGVLGTVVLLAAAAATLALNVLVASQAPFEEAFARANGAHLVVEYDGSMRQADVAATADADVVTDSTGPWTVATALVRGGGDGMGGQAVSSRSDPNSSVDAVVVSEGRWWRTPDEVVVGRQVADDLEVGLGDQITLTPQPANAGPGPGGGGPVPLNPGKSLDQPDAVATLTIVGIARSVSTPDVAAWTSPTHVAALSGATAPAWQMLYRVDPGAAAADLAGSLAAITGDLPADAVASASTYLDTKAGVDDVAQLYVPILLAFAVFAFGAAGFMIANSVSGIVLTNYREIGVMKAVGFTPAQIVAILLVQVVVPVAIGAVAGAGLGVLGSASTVERLTRAFGLPGAFSASLPVVAIVVVGSVGLAMLAAIGPSIGAGRISAVQAISIGSAGANGSGGGRLRRIGLRLPISLPVRLGLAAGLVHPVRAAMTLGALLVGVAAVTFALSLNLSLLRVMTQLDRTEATTVRAQVGGDPSASGSDVTAAIEANPDTGRFIAFGAATVSTRGLGDITFVGYDGDAGWIGYELIRGRWVTGPGEVVAPTKLIRDARLEIGDLLEVTGPDGSTTVRLVGETFESSGDDTNGHVLRGAWADVTAVDPGATIDSWEILPDVGILPSTYASWLMNATNGRVGAWTLNDTSVDEEFLLFLSVVALMGAVLVATSLGGVFNTVLLETRHRTRELAVLKALGLSPRQVVAMVVSTVVPVGLLAGLLGVPIGLVLQRAVLSYMAETAAETAVPNSTFDVLSPPVFVALALAGLAMASLGAFLPGQRAARLPIAPVLQAE